MTDQSRFRSPRESRVAAITVLIFGAALCGVVLFSLRGSSGGATFSATTLPGSGHIVFSPGTPDPSSPSGLAPQGTRLGAYSRTYATNFSGTTVPPGWFAFTGIPGGDPTGQFAATHVTVGGGMLHLNTWRDPLYGNKWVTGGLCHCGHSQTFGAYFVRSRVTGAGPNVSELLWPADNSWPPEIDFNETGAKAISTSWTVHFGAHDSIRQETLHIDLTKWHTWGVQWSPTAITFLVDGLQWGVFPFASEIPHIPMTLDLQQRAGCGVGAQASDRSGFVCPKHPRSLLVDWVTEYARH